MVIAFLKGLDLARIAVWAVAGLSLGFAIWFHGYMTGDDNLTEYKGKQATEAVSIVVKQGKVTEKVITEYVTVTVPKTEVVTRTIEKEVIRYETAKLDTCPLSVAAVSLHDSAAANTVPDPARSIDGTPSGIETSALTKTATENYALCHQTANRLRALQEWVTEQSKVR